MLTQRWIANRRRNLELIAQRSENIGTDESQLVREDRSWYSVVKRPLECAFSLLLLVLSFPVLILAALAVKLTSRGPFLYTQTRLGRYGRPFTIFKLRTMHDNCERKSGVCWSTKGDPRVTAVGRFLRATHIDELPQLWNVLCGEMSLIGPRPERPEFIPGLEREVPSYRERTRVRPGITGLAQVRLPPDTDIESVRRKVAQDLYYIENLSFWLDLRILASTLSLVMGLNYCFRFFFSSLRNSSSEGFVAEPMSARST